MIRLSKKGWNNVLIFSMLIMIFLFNGLHHKIIDTESDDIIQSILKEQSYILTIEYPLYKIERIGTGWRSNSQLTGPQIFELSINWQQATGLRITDIDAIKSEFKNKQAENIVTIWLAGEALPQVYAFFKLGQDYFIHMPKAANETWLKLTSDQVKLLFPEDI
ncbi:hypothetical protein CJF42_12025 [Pseudoalteromonas sp. NBT06-2]|nr:hypothetical protein CJF42_12025 [Pseudoalteromonas sp. NBT06-2]